MISQSMDLLDPNVINFDSIAGDQILNVLLGMCGLSGVGNFALEVNGANIRALHPLQKTEIHYMKCAKLTSNICHVHL